MAKGKMGFEGGKYSAKSGDLSKAQLKRAGATKAAAKRTVDIGSTSRATEGVNKGKTLGAGGKPLTGSVKLANGQMAVYKAGKRVINVKSSKGSNPTPPAPPPPKTGSYQAGSGTTSTAGAKARAEAQGIIYANRNKPKNMDVEAKRVADKKRPAAGKSTLSTPSTTSTSNANRPSAKGILVKIAQLDAQIKRTTQANIRLDLERKRNALVKTARGIGDFFR